MSESRRGRDGSEADPVVPDVSVHGAAPYRIALVHGGPGAVGDLADVAAELAERLPACGIVETAHRALSIDGQVAELAGAIERHMAPPAVLVGHSWGAWLCLLTAARRPELVSKVVLVAAGPLLEEHAHLVPQRRLARLTADERALWSRAAADLAEEEGDRSRARHALTQLGRLSAKADAYAPLPRPRGPLAAGASQIFRAVWPEAQALRRSGALRDAAVSLRCPVVAIQGAEDPHPPEGIAGPLAALTAFRMIELPRCGHVPWIEAHAREPFFAALSAELDRAGDTHQAVQPPSTGRITPVT